MAEYLANAAQDVNLNAAAILNASIPCPCGNVFHEDGTGIFILRGNTRNCFARYQVIYNVNIALPESATVVPIAVAININGEERSTSKAIFTPAAVQQFGNVSGTAIITVPRGCCFTASVDAVPGSTDPTVTPAPVITMQNLNVTITRIA